MQEYGSVVIPVSVRATLHFQAGEKLIARALDECLVLEPLSLAIRKAQALVAGHVPSGSAIVDELIAERHAIADTE